MGKIIPIEAITKAINEHHLTPCYWSFVELRHGVNRSDSSADVYSAIIRSKTFPDLLVHYKIEYFPMIGSAFAWYIESP